MKIDVYDDFCRAAQAVGPVLFGPTDFNEDCMTNIEDIAELVFNWLEDYILIAIENSRFVRGNFFSNKYLPFYPRAFTTLKGIN